ncbi:hypothetical protein T484DRAFT_1816864 [Baffinella frigidus]|nr:hypothetical protein T484DRAFT_1816864 [Cryptophyta sp. CCMP2293]
MQMHKGRIWVVGGTDGTNALSSVEAMDPREGAWKEMIPLRKTRAGCACAELNGKLVVTSGRQYSDCISTAEFTAEERAKARADITYRQLRVKEFVDTVEIWDDRALKWDELTHRSGDKENGFDRAVAAYTVL